MNKCNFFFIVSFAVLFGWFSYLYTQTYHKKSVYNYLTKISELEEENKELKNKLNEYKLKTNR